MQVFPSHITSRPTVRLHDQHPSGVVGASRVELESVKGKAIADGYLTISELLLTVWQVQARHAFYEDLPGAGRLIFVFHLTGTREIELENCGRHKLQPHRFSVYYHPHGVQRRGIWPSGSNQLSIGVGFWPSQLSESLVSAFKLVPELAPALEESGEPLWIDSNFTYAMEHAARQIINPSVHPSLLRHFLTIKTNELLCAGIDALLNTHVEPGEGIDIIRHKAVQVQNLIDANLNEPPKLQDLADAYYIRANILADEFKQLTGLTVGQYFIQRRMDRAMLLLMTTAIPLKQIAYKLGYNHTSNFCIAFKRHFGQTPKEVRLVH